MSRGEIVAELTALSLSKQTSKEWLTTGQQITGTIESSPMEKGTRNAKIWDNDEAFQWHRKAQW